MAIRQINNSPLQSQIFISELDERRTTIKSIFSVLRQAVHPNSGELLDEERKAVVWMIYLVECLVEDDQAEK